MRGGLRLRLRNGVPGRVRGLEVHLELDGARVEPGFIAGGDGGPELLLVLQVLPERRGLCRLGQLELRTTYPFGLMEKAWRLELGQELWVLPYPRNLPARPQGQGQVPRAKPRAGAASPEGTRPFREGDPLSRVHWKRTAQRGTPWVRSYEAEAASSLRLHLDLRAWQAGPGFERELEILSGGILQARLHRQQVFLSVVFSSGSKDYVGFRPCWRALALAQAEQIPGHGSISALPLPYDAPIMR